MTTIELYYNNYKGYILKDNTNKNKEQNSMREDKYILLMAIIFIIIALIS